MKKYYLFTLLFSALIFGASSSVSAQNAVRTSADVSRETEALRVEAQVKVRADMKATYEAQKARGEAQREQMKSEAEARKAAAEARGDEMQAKREAMRIELEAKRTEMDSRREAMRVEFESRRTEMQDKRAEFREDIAKRKVENTERVITITIERLERIIVRVESRIAKIKAQDGVTTESEDSVSVAKGHLADAKASLAVFVSIDLSGETAESNFERIRAVAAEVREHIRAAHQNLMIAVRSLSSVEVGLGLEAEAGVSTE